MSEPNEPTASRRAVLQLLAGTAAYSALAASGRKAPTLAVPWSCCAMAISRSSSTPASSGIALPAAGHEAALGDFAASEYVVTHDDRTLDDFTLAEQRLEPVRDAVHGPGRRLTLRGELGTLEKSVQVTLYERHPGFAILRTSYHNTSDAPLRLARWVNARIACRPPGTVRHSVHSAAPVTRTAATGCSALRPVSSRATSWA